MSGLHKTRTYWAIAFAASALLTFTQLSDPARTDQLTPAQPNQPTYQSSDVRLQYPYQEQMIDGQSRADPGRVGVSFASTWSTEAYPGKSTCMIEVLDSAGGLVGSLQFGLDTYTRSADIGPIVVEVGQPPTDAHVFCAAAPILQGAGVYFTDMSVALIEGSRSTEVRLKAISHWVDGLRPPVQLCTATLTLADGATGSVAFTLEAGDGHAFEVVLEPQFAGAADPRISCERFTG